MNKNVSIIGLGKLGLCLALNLEKNGYNIIGVDIINEYIESLKNKTFKTPEKDVEKYLKECKNIKFSSCLKDALAYDSIFIVVNTPSTNDWKYDHYQIDRIIDELIKLGRQDKRKDIIINCTTFPKYCKSVQERLNDYNYYVSYNPEFIAQGTIIRDQQYPDMILIGQADEYAGNLIEKINIDICKNIPVVSKMSVTEAEITKLSINCFLTTKISYANMIGDIALEYECNPSIILNAIGSDSRIGNKYLKHGYGFGGPCFPRDNRALAKCADEVGIDAVISKSTDEYNKLHLNYQIKYHTKIHTDKNKKVVFDFVTYKKESTLLEESQQLKFAEELKQLGYIIEIKDNRKEVMDNIKNLITDL
jgi:nucleotide sugar dehydrogenase